MILLIIYHLVKLTERNAGSNCTREPYGNRSDRLHTEYLTLKELRKARKITQHQLAKSLSVRQVTVAQMEMRAAPLCSRPCVAMSRRWVEFPGKPVVHLAQLGDPDAPAKR